MTEKEQFLRGGGQVAHSAPPPVRKGKIHHLYNTELLFTRSPKGQDARHRLTYE